MYIIVENIDLDVIRRTGLGHWKGKCWIPNVDTRPKIEDCGRNPNFDPESKCMWFNLDGG
jgi:hypothetical protein